MIDRHLACQKSLDRRNIRIFIEFVTLSVYIKQLKRKHKIALRRFEIKLKHNKLSATYVSIPHVIYYRQQR